MPNNKKNDKNKNDKPMVIDDSFAAKNIEALKKQKRMSQKDLKELIKRLSTLYFEVD
jgi:hypothetical protein